MKQVFAQSPRQLKLNELTETCIGLYDRQQEVRELYSHLRIDRNTTFAHVMIAAEARIVPGAAYNKWAKMRDAYDKLDPFESEEFVADMRRSIKAKALSRDDMVLTDDEVNARVSAIRNLAYYKVCCCCCCCCCCC